MAKLTQFKQQRAALRARPGGKDDCADKDYAQRNQRTIATLKSLLAALVKADPAHPATLKAQEIAAAINLR